MVNKSHRPDLIFETSWEVCNMVGGIYTVLSTRAKTLQEHYPERVLFIGPDLSAVGAKQADFKPLKSIYKAWQKRAALDGLPVRMGRWDVPGKPLAILVDFQKIPFNKSAVYAKMWEHFDVDSLHAYGDYDEACHFATSVARVMEHFIAFHQLETSRVIAHFNEWTTGMGLLYCKKHCPTVSTVFTTHATSIGRSICGNNLPLYDFLSDYNGDQMARELNMQAKHSLEKAAAHQADCFTTVSDITATECEQLLDIKPDVVTPNGFEPGFVKQGKKGADIRKASRNRIFEVAEAVFGCPVSDETLLVGISGRNEFRNKGLDVFVDAMHRLRSMTSLQGDVLAVIMVPGDVSAPRMEVLDRLNDVDVSKEGAIYFPWLTHWLNHVDQDRVLNQIRYRGFLNAAGDKVKILYVPCYLNGSDGIFDRKYYDLLAAFDLTVFPSYYEPWGYTPLESIAFSVPTITTQLAGFGAWARKMGDKKGLADGVEVINRSDHNYADVVKEIALLVHGYAQMSATEREMIGEQARLMAQKAEWSAFFDAYEQAYRIALK